MNFLEKQQGIENAQADQYSKDHKARSEDWGGPYCLKQCIVAAIEEGKTSIVAAMINYQEPDLQALEKEIMVEYGYGSEEFEVNFRIPPFRIPPSKLACFEITLRYPVKKRNVRGVGRPSTGETHKVTLSGLSKELHEFLCCQPNKSLFLRSLLQEAYDRQ